MARKSQLHWPPARLDRSRFGQAVTVDLVIFTIKESQLKVLLIKRPHEPFQNSRALPGGFLLQNETTQKAALRILKEKAGVSNVYIEQLYTFDSPKRDPRGHVLTVTYFALVPRSKLAFAKRTTQTPTFHSIQKLPMLAFDHKAIVKYAVRRLRAKLEYTNAVLSLLPHEFTFNQLQKTYEAILDKKLDKRNFRKKFLSLGLIKQTRKHLKNVRQRPARLYQFIHRKQTELKKFF